MATKYPTYFDITNMTEGEARAYLESVRWPKGPRCVHCGGEEVTRLQGESTRPGVLKCKTKECRKQFTVTVGTIFHRSRIALKKWLLGFHHVCASKKAVSALQLQRMLDLKTYKTAWHMAHRIRLALAHGFDTDPLKGRVEMDETYVGPAPKNLRLDRRKKYRETGRGTMKVPVMVLVERGGRARAEVTPNVRAAEALRLLRKYADPDARLNTDEFPMYRGVGKGWPGGHDVIRHKVAYAVGENHTNSAESFNALVKRCIMGAWHHVSHRHLNRYLGEICFRWDTRNMTDAARAHRALQQSDGVRLAYRPPAA